MAPLLALLLFLSFSYGGEEIEVPRADLVLGKTLPNLTLILDSGEEADLLGLSSGSPVILSFIYTRCTSACPMIVRGIKDALKSSGNQGAKVLLINFDLRDKPSDLIKFRERHKIPSDWAIALLREKDLVRLTGFLDFRFRYDQETDMFAHPNVLVIISPQLMVSGYMLGVRYNSEKLRNILSLARVNRADINPVKGFLLRCFRYDPVTGKYAIDWSFVAMVLGGTIPIAGMFYFIFLKDAIAGLRRRGEART